MGSKVCEILLTCALQMGSWSCTFVDALTEGYQQWRREQAMLKPIMTVIKRT